MNDLIEYSPYQLDLMGEASVPITKEQADKVMAVLSMPNPPKFLQIGGEMYAVHQLRRVIKRTTSLGELKEQDMKYHRSQREWKCPKGLWHSAKYEDCSCEYADSYQRAWKGQVDSCIYCQQIVQFKDTKEQDSSFSKELDKNFSV